MGDLPTEFDVVVLGTGLIESIIAAASARNGHTVLQLDPREYYSGKWATLSWEQWTSGVFASRERPISDYSENSDLNWRNNIRELDQVWYTSDNDLKEEIKRKSRQFNIDIYPKVLMARDDLIQLLIQSNVARYLEFKCVNQFLCNLPSPEESRLEIIPLTKSDIFTSKALSLVEKRNLMKFIEQVVKSSTTATTSEVSPSPSQSSNSSSKLNFTEFSDKYNLSEKGKHFVKAALRPENDQKDFADRCRLFLESIGRYGNQTPFLWTLYGISEICQSFCRLAAIYGAIFILRRYIEKVQEIDSELQITSGEDVIKAKYLVLGPETSLKNQKCPSTKSIARAVLLTKGRAIKIDESKSTTSTEDVKKQKGVVMYTIDDMDIIELDSSCQAVPEILEDNRIVHISMKIDPQPCSSIRNIIESKMEAFLDFTSAQTSSSTSPVEVGVEEGKGKGEKNIKDKDHGQLFLKPQVLYGSYYFLDFYEMQPEHEDKENKKVFHCGTLSSDISSAINRSKLIFSQMYPQEEFLPKAPDADNFNNNEDEEDHLIEPPIPEPEEQDPVVEEILPLSSEEPVTDHE